MALSSSSKENISIKKLVGKAHSSNSLEAFNESKTTGLTLSTTTIFADAITDSPTSENLYDITGNVEYVRLLATPIPESLVSGKYHAFKLSLPADYETNSSNANSGSLSFLNSQDLHSTTGQLQLVPPSFSDSYEAKVYYGGTSAKNSGTRIPLLDERSWYLDYFNGIIFQETPPDNSNENPDYIEAFIYVGRMASERIAANNGQGGATQLNSLTDVTIGNIALAENHVLVYTSSNVFENKILSSTQLSDSDSLIRNTSSISDLSDVHDLTNIQVGNVLAWTSNNRFEFTTPAVTYTDEEARNAAAQALENGSHTGITFSNDNDNDQIDAVVSISNFSIGDLQNVDITGIQNNNILKYENGTFTAVEQDSFTADTASLWEVSDDGTELYPHGIIDGTIDTGMFAIELSAGSMNFTDLNVTLYDVLEELSNLNAYTLSSRNQQEITDSYWEFDNDGNVMPKAAV